MSVIQRQMLLDSLAQLRILAQGSQKGCSSRNCCPQATRIASSRSQPTLSIIARQQQRNFAVSYSLQKDDMSLDPQITSPKGKEKMPAEVADDVVVDQNSKILYAADPDMESGSITSSSAITAQSGSMGNSGDGTGPGSSLGKRKKKAKWSNMIIRMTARSSPWLVKRMEGLQTIEDKVEACKTAIDDVHYAWSRAQKDEGTTFDVPFHIKVASELTWLGDRCRRIRKDKESFDLLQKRAGRHLHDIINLAEHQMEQQGSRDEEQVYILGCLRVRAWSLEDNQEKARNLIDTLLKDEEEWMEDFQEVEELSLKRRVRKGSHPRLHHLADALGGVLQVTLNRLTDLHGDDKVNLAQNTMDWLLKQPNRFRFNSFIFTNLIFRFNLIIYALKDPAKYIQDRLHRLERREVTTLTSSICRSLLRNNAVLQTYNLYHWAVKERIALDESVVRLLMRTATLEKEQIIAANIGEGLLDRARRGERVLELSTCRMMAWSYARRKDEKKMEEMLRIIAAQYDQEAVARQLFEFEARLLCYTQHGSVERVVKLVEGRFDMRIAPGQIPEDGLLYPDFQMHARLVQVYLKASQKDEAELMLYRMVEFGHRPNINLMNSVLDYYAKVGDVFSTLSLYLQMNTTELMPDSRTYTALISLFARRKDVDSASKVITVMKKRGIRPDRIAYNALLNAHVETGDWQGATELFTWMLNSKDYRVRPSTSAYNTMLKAHVLRAIPIQDTFSFFKKMMAAGMAPDAHTFTLVLQSVADAGFMDLAEQVFTSIDNRLGGLGGTEIGKGAGIWHFTIMIQGYLRQKELDRARHYANELRERGQTATGVLWGVLVKAYAAREEEAGVEDSYNLVQMAEFDRVQDYAAAYQPLIQAYNKRANAERVEELLEELADKGTDIPLHFWVTLMDAFRRQNNMEGTLEIWDLIFDKALEANKFSEDLDSNSSPRPIRFEKADCNNLLCLPLSILIDLLTKRGEYERVAQEWLRCRKAGFGFDSHNWNHLCASFLKAGRLRDSLNIISRVLDRPAPSREWHDMVLESANVPSFSISKTERVQQVGEDADDSNNSSLEELNEGEKTETPFRPPNRRHQLRVRDDLDARYPLEEADERREEDRLERSDSSEWQEISQDERQVYSDQERGSQSDAPDSTILDHLETQSRIDEAFSPWFAHFETMLQLNGVIDSIEKSGGVARLEDDTTVSLNELRETYPRPFELLATFQTKLDNIQEQARIEAIRSRRFR